MLETSKVITPTILGTQNQSLTLSTFKRVPWFQLQKPRARTSTWRGMTYDNVKSSKNFLKMVKFSETFSPSTTQPRFSRVWQQLMFVCLLFVFLFLGFKWRRSLSRANEIKRQRGIWEIQADILSTSLENQTRRMTHRFKLSHESIGGYLCSARSNYAAHKLSDVT